MNFVELDIKMRVKRAKYGSIPDAIDIELPYPLDNLIIPKQSFAEQTNTDFEFTQEQLDYLKGMGIDLEQIPMEHWPSLAEHLDKLIQDYEQNVKNDDELSIGPMESYYFQSHDNSGGGLAFYYDPQSGTKTVYFKEGDFTFYASLQESSLIDPEFRDGREFIYRDGAENINPIIIPPSNEQFDTELDDPVEEDSDVLDDDMTQVKVPDDFMKFREAKYDDSELQSNLEHQKGAKSDEALSEKLGEVKNELSMSWYDWGVDDGNVANVWQWLQDLYEQNPNDYAYVVIQMKNDPELNYLERLFDETYYEHIAEYYDIITKTSFFMPPSELFIDLQDLAAYESAAAIIDPIGSYFEKSGLQDLSKEDLKAFAKEQTDVYFSLKLYEIEYYVENGMWDELESILMETYGVMDMILQILFVENREDYDNMYLNNPLLMKAIEKAYLDKEPSKEAKNFRPTLLNMDSQPVDNYGNSITVDSEQQEDGEDEDQSNEDDFAASFSLKVAEETKTFFAQLEELIEKNPELLTVIEKVRLETKTLQTNMLTDSVEINDESEELTESSKKDLTWADLSKIWLWELGDTELGGSKSNPLQFEEGDKTTEDVRNLTGTRDALNIAYKKATRGDFSVTELSVWYDKEAFMNSVESKNIPFNFLGSYKITIKPQGTENMNEVVFDVVVENTSGWESATRFGPRDENTQMKEPIIDNTVRGESVKLGGSLVVQWKWQEPKQHIYYER